MRRGADQAEFKLPSEIDTRPDDLVQPFRIDPFALRGRLVRLGPTVDRILSQHDYPEPVAAMLGEAITLAVVLAGALKYDGVFTLADQERRAGPADRRRCLDRGRGARLCAIRRGEARRGDRRETAEVGGSPRCRALIGSGYIAFTVDQGEHTERYQGIVELPARPSPNAPSIISANRSRSRPASNWRSARSGRGRRAGAPAG